MAHELDPKELVNFREMVRAVLNAGSFKCGHPHLFADMVGGHPSKVRYKTLDLGLLVRCPQKYDVVLLEFGIEVVSGRE